MVNEEREYIACDTCSVLTMTNYILFYEKNGEEAYNELVEKKASEYKAAKKALLNYMGYDFANKYEELGIKALTRLYKTQNKLNKKQANEFNKLIQDYYKCSDAYENALAVKKSFQENVGLAITPTVLDELMVHMSPKTKYIIQNYFTYFEIDDELVPEVAKLAAYYRTQTNCPNTKAMSKDKNSVGVFGDSTVAAEQVICGINMVTNNLKDFIVDISRVEANDAKRQHIDRVNKSGRCAYASDARAYSLLEFILGKTRKVTASALISKSAEKSMDFKEVVVVTKNSVHQRIRAREDEEGLSM